MHDRTRFEVFCYALTRDDGTEWRRRISTEVEHFRDISAHMPADGARAIHHDGIQILINLNGYTKGARNEIFALQPAPVQVSYMGFCGTLGAPYVQYMVADRTVIPEDLERYYSEKLVVMPHSYFVNDHKQRCGTACMCVCVCLCTARADAAAVAARSAREVLNNSLCPDREHYGIPKDKFVFCNFNQVYKISPDVFQTWVRILKRVPNSVLWLLRFPALAEVRPRRSCPQLASASLTTPPPPPPCRSTFVRRRAQRGWQTSASFSPTWRPKASTCAGACWATCSWTPPSATRTPPAATSCGAARPC